MRVLILDENLIWSQRLRTGVAALGHEPLVMASRGEMPVADCAIVNLGSRVFEPRSTMAALRANGTRVIAHAGHKEKPLLELAESCEADLVVTNGTLTHKLAEVLERVGVRP